MSWGVEILSPPVGWWLVCRLALQPWTTPPRDGVPQQRQRARDRVRLEAGELLDLQHYSASSSCERNASEQTLAPHFLLKRASHPPIVWSSQVVGIPMRSVSPQWFTLGFVVLALLGESVLISGMTVTQLVTPGGYPTLEVPYVICKKQEDPSSGNVTFISVPFASQRFFFADAIQPPPGQVSISADCRYVVNATCGIVAAGELISAILPSSGTTTCLQPSCHRAAKFGHVRRFIHSS